jgi:DNA-binding MarR family transcriptional regulator
MTDKHIQRIRQFNRFYTDLLGLLDEHILNSGYSIPAVRVLNILYQHQPCLASHLLKYIEIDKGYLSRILKSLERRGILVRKKNKDDGRASDLSLTRRGEKDYLTLNQASIDQLQHLLSPLRDRQGRALTRHMVAIETLLSVRSRKK